MSNEEPNVIQDDNRITLSDILKVLNHYKKMIIIITITVMIGIIIFSFISIILPSDKSPLPNKYTANAKMLISNNSQSQNISSIMNSAGLGTLANIVGVSATTNSTIPGLVSYLLHSNFVLDELNKQFDFCKLYNVFDTPKSNVRNLIKKNLNSQYDETTGILTISFKDVNPLLTKDVVNSAVTILEKKLIELDIDKNKAAKENIEDNIKQTMENIETLQDEIVEIEKSVSIGMSSPFIPSVAKNLEIIRLELEAQKEIYKQLKAQDELLKVKLGSDVPVFQILEYAEVPDIKSGPSRAILCIVVVFSTFMATIFLAFLLNAIKMYKKNMIY